ncbi:hypothetical protein B0I72DRAFT_133261 [Yarrowia lipolytica]|uniref:YALI0E07183p n=3 Tax=Yarrowia lipolytica TaxID=4952 RepID=Q6C6Q6_YARLI|nr:YALI0E07183p [Yarrowia lipolytica CLIB122]KAB8286117.1 hypothetical protein BKA91DRAFT_131972 [Yarrowia lipolytica]KAE8171381.1 hypothetical protein BKA90DRAFT_139100 [Yarrowia lipolytica]KAJ8056632.1 hypothetical protein LXG23DRAFT_33526 [Yarrowia lipolytica]QNP98842.1 Putative 26S proteasome regulatory subunit rpn9 [Yarrowia lipolytica]RDW27785.1 hypothetical protein B0I71DRAFT_128508 [Yarrowia lipolytica]|eukprot:XP_503656.1 YALI0E07183p [Yarrowia lipolytica CLIB122]
MEIDNDVPTILATLRMEADPELAATFYSLEDLWERKLWHQLTDALAELYADPRSKPLRLRIFTQFIQVFERNLNQLKLVIFGVLAAAQCNNDEETLGFLTSLADKVSHKPDTQDAYVYAQIEIARVKLRLKDMDGAREVLNSVTGTIDSLNSVDPIITAAYYGVNADYYLSKGDFNTYYRNALLYLACIDLSTLSVEAVQKRAHELSVAALLGEKIHNFGELLLHPVLDSLKNTEYAWLRDLLFALNQGDISEFEKLTSQHVSKLPPLEAAMPLLRQKICLTALTEAAFKRPTNDRTLTFAAVAKETQLPADEIEHLVMKALSLELIKGHIDQVAQTITITWLQPRVLNKQQIADMKQRLDQWDANVKQLGGWIHDRGEGVWLEA